MKILILHTASDLYGASKILLIVCRILKNQGHQPSVVLSEDGPLVDKLQKLEIPVYIIRLGILRRKYFNIPGMLNRVRVSLSAWRSLNILIRRESPKLIYSNTTGVLLGGFLAKKHRLTHIWHVHEIIEKPAAFTRVIGYLLNHFSDQVIVVSDAVKKHWAKSVRLEKLHRIYNGLDISPFQDTRSTLREELQIAPDTLLIGMIGRINHWKGQHYFLDIAEQILRKYPDTRFVMAGDPFPGNEYLETELTNRLIANGLSKQIINLGYRTDIVNILNGLDIFVLPSILPDPFPTVILEAMSAGKTIVATAQGGALEMVENGKSGMHIPIGDARQAFELIEPLLKDSDLRTNLGTEARQRVLKEFSFQSFEKKISSIISDRGE